MGYWIPKLIRDAGASLTPLPAGTTAMDFFSRVASPDTSLGLVPWMWMIACSEGSTPLFVVARFPYVKIGLRLVRMLIDFKMCVQTMRSKSLSSLALPRTAEFDYTHIDYISR